MGFARASIVVFLLMATRPGASFGQVRQDEPTQREIADAFRSKSGEGGTFIPHLRWERWRIREVRGWSLQFKHIRDDRAVGVLIARYRVVARKNGICAEYQITDIIPLPNVQIRPRLVVDPSGVGSCH